MIPPAAETDEWPADAGALAAAREFLRATTDQLVVIACDSDVDGLASAVILERTMTGLGAQVAIEPLGRGQTVHGETMRSRMAAHDPNRLVVLDTGSRPLPIMPDVPTLIIDHHHAAAGTPPGAIVVNSDNRPPVATASVLSYVVCRTVAAIEMLGWLGGLGAQADLGSAAPFRRLLDGGRSAPKNAIALLNAARRAPDPDPRVALALLRRARTPEDLTSGQFPELMLLETARRAVRAEADRCARTPPLVGDRVALLRFSSRAQVHPLVAIRWSRRLRPRIVMAANDEYLPGRVNFAVRCDAHGVDLVRWLRTRPFTPQDDGEYAHGHARASGGSLSVRDFERLVSAVGLPFALA